MMNKWKWIAIGASVLALLILLTLSGTLCGKTSALLGALAAGGAAKLTSARQKTDDRLEETKTTISSANELSARTKEEVQKAREKAESADIDDLIARANDRERDRGRTTIR